MALDPSRSTVSDKPPVREVDVEVMPKGHRPGAPADPVLAILAKLLDSLLTIPGTKIKVGLDPIIALLPVGGGAASAIISLFFLFRSAQLGVPNHVLARMAGNIVANTVLDEIPIVGDFLSIFFRSNKLNYELLEKHAGTRRPATFKDRLFIAGLVGGLIFLIVCLIVGLAFVTRAAWHAIFG